MSTLPKDLTEAIAKSQISAKTAIEDGLNRIMVELVFPELRSMDIAHQFLPIFTDYGNTLKVFFPDTGAAALARRDWANVNFKISDLGSSRNPIDQKIQEEDRIFILVEPSVIEIEQVEKLCDLAGDRPVILLLPRLEDATNIGIGYAARQIRTRFLNLLESVYYIRPLNEAALHRAYPGPWEVWREKENDYELIAELPQKPIGEELDNILLPPSTPDQPSNSKSPGIFTELKRFIRALNR
jgi:hypothetical protein